MNSNRNIYGPHEATTSVQAWPPQDVLGLPPSPEDRGCHMPVSSPPTTLGESVAHPSQSQEPLVTLVLAHHLATSQLPRMHRLQRNYSPSHGSPWTSCASPLSPAGGTQPFPGPAHPKKVPHPISGPADTSSLNSLLCLHTAQPSALSHRSPPHLPRAFVVSVPCSLAAS